MKRVTFSPAERGIVVTTVPDYCVDEVADHAVALILAAERHLESLSGSVRSGGAGHRTRFRSSGASAGSRSACSAAARSGRLPTIRSGPFAPRASRRTSPTTPQRASRRRSAGAPRRSCERSPGSRRYIPPADAQLGIGFHSGGEAGISTALYCQFAAALAVLPYALDSHFHHQTDDVPADALGDVLAYVEGKMRRETSAKAELLEGKSIREVWDKYSAL